MQLSQSVAIIDEIKKREVSIPVSYQKAVTAIKECDAIDEAKDWADKMSALALYYKQSKDKTLEDYAKRIRIRAERRMGELLRQFDGRGGDRKSDNIKSTVNDTFETQKHISEEIGLSKRQKDQSIRLSNIPEETFNEMVESENVPTLSQLAELGTKKTVKVVNQNNKDSWKVNERLKEIAKLLKEYDAIYTIEGMDQDLIESTVKTISEIENWFDTFIVNIKKY
jgi:hypothetical protein